VNAGSQLAGSRSTTICDRFLCCAGSTDVLCSGGAFDVVLASVVWSGCRWSEVRHRGDCWRVSRLSVGGWKRCGIGCSKCGVNSRTTSGRIVTKGAPRYSIIGVGRRTVMASAGRGGAIVTLWRSSSAFATPRSRRGCRYRFETSGWVCICSPAPGWIWGPGRQSNEHTPPTCNAEFRPPSRWPLPHRIRGRKWGTQGSRTGRRACVRCGLSLGRSRASDRAIFLSEPDS